MVFRGCTPTIQLGKVSKIGSITYLDVTACMHQREEYANNHTSVVVSLIKKNILPSVIPLSKKLHLKENGDRKEKLLQHLLKKRN